MLQERVLVLNSTYEAINICSAKRALVMILAGKADVVENSFQQIHAARLAMPRPEVIKLRRFINLPYRPIPFCRKNILLRDNYSCQYCGKQFSPEHLTLDHVIPISKLGKDSWTNVVTACKKCNHQKGNMTLDEAGMRLLHRPQKPTLPTYLHLVRLIGQKRDVWRKYLFFDEEKPAEAVVC
ncbi:MAG: HNH endonuclease [bacterium]|jgi:5-methylcytosine-specific restriction endonuclease McrA|nr:HNH endonuclease [bacterium]